MVYRPLELTQRHFLGLSDMQQGILKDSDIGNGTLLKSKWRYEEFLNLTGQHLYFL